MGGHLICSRSVTGDQPILSTYNYDFQQQGCGPNPPTWLNICKCGQ